MRATAARAARELGKHYARLGLVRGASKADVVAAYRSKALETHPDRGGCAQEFATLTHSYETVLADATDGPTQARGRARVYNPSSLRSHGNRAYSGSQNRDDSGRVMTAIVVPLVTLCAISVRLLYTGQERPGLRAGGTSLYKPEGEPDIENDDL